MLPASLVGSARRWTQRHTRTSSSLRTRGWGILSARDAWREIPVDKTLYLRWWFYRADEVPAEHEDRLAWLYARWEDIDSWIAEHRS